ncbi:HD domain-containing protein [Patescibacteria group bacterium]|nr:HD domain-containing protein [Patescibacteria group bacterium]
MKDLIQKFKENMIANANDPNFRHHQWFVKYHLEIVYQIAMELCDIYPEANRDMVEVLVWLHDYGKPLDFENEKDVTLVKGREKLTEIVFPPDFVDQAIEYTEFIDRRRDMDQYPIEVQIISSADAASHFVGPFYACWWHENPQKTVEELGRDNQKVHAKDWDRKMVLPEVKEAFKLRNEYKKEMWGEFPDKFLN